MDLMNVGNEVEKVAVGIELEGAVDRYGDEIRWDEFRSSDKNYVYEVERKGVVKREAEE